MPDRFQHLGVSRLAPIAAAVLLLSGCGDDELAPVVPDPPDLTTVEGAVTALEDAYSYQEAANALSYLGSSYRFVPALPESIPFLEPAETSWTLNVETDVLENMLVPERLNWLDQVLLQITILNVVTTKEGLKVVDAVAELSLLEGNDNYIRSKSNMQLVYEVDGNGNHLLIEERESLPAGYDPAIDVLVADQKVRVLPEDYDPDAP
jgi:hypothetical protein